MFKKIAIYFSIWRIALFFVAFLATYLIPVFGARFPYADRVLEITKLPSWIWGFGNFDGVHYLRIAQDGYAAQYSQAFFPLFPILVRAFSFIFPKNLAIDTAIFTDPAYFYSGLVLSNILFLFALYIFYKLVSLDFKKGVAVLSVIFLLIFPTSFYFGAIYTESLFLLLAVSAIYLARKEKYFWAAVLISLSTATRITGVFLIPLFVIEIIKSKKCIKLWWTLLTPLGILAYMLFLKQNFGNPFYFLTAQPVFGAARLADGLVLLPQVIIRYIRIFLSTNILSLPFFNASLEFLFTFVPLAILVASFRKIRLSYLVFSASALLFPTLTGTLSSIPRYALTAMVLIIPYIVIRFKKAYIYLLIVLGVLGAVCLALFIRGYWVS